MRIAEILPGIRSKVGRVLDAVGVAGDRSRDGHGQVGIGAGDVGEAQWRGIELGFGDRGCMGGGARFGRIRAFAGGIHRTHYIVICGRGAQSGVIETGFHDARGDWDERPTAGGRAFDVVGARSGTCWPREVDVAIGNGSGG